MAQRNDGGYLVIAFFDTRAAGTAAARAVAHETSMYGLEGITAMMTLDQTGHPEVAGFGERSSERDDAVETILHVIASTLLGSVMPARRHFFDPASDLTTDDVVRIGVELEAGHAAVAALARRSPAERIVVQLAGLGGKAEIHRLSVRAVEQAAAVAGQAL